MRTIYVLNKARRNFGLEIQSREDDDVYLKIDPPITIEFDVSQKNLVNAAEFSVTIYNLSQEHRNLINFGYWDRSRVKFVKFQAGYGSPTPEQQKDLDDKGLDLYTAYADDAGSESKLSTIFEGTIVECQSYRQGVNYLTKLTAQSFGSAVANAEINETIEAGFEDSDYIARVLKDLEQHGIQKGVIGDYSTVRDRAQSFTGNPIEEANRISNGGLFVYNGKYYVLKDEECLFPQGLDVIDDSTGLLGTPTQESGFINLDMIFEPRIILGQLVELNSNSIKKELNGPYKVVSIHHHGMISESASGSLITTLGLDRGKEALKAIG